MKNLLWITDAHLDHLGAAEQSWHEKLANSDADMLLLGGDIANSRMFSRALGRIRETFPGKIALVAGNHDYYHGSIAGMRTEFKALQRHDVAVFEPGCQSQPLELADGIYLCGSGGWGDASAGTANASDMPLNDERFITELKNGNLNKTLRQLGQHTATHLQDQLAEIPTDARCVIVLTHVPPWPEACWHEGRPSDAYALPRFCWQAGGKIISHASEAKSQTQFIVLCGHTHSDGYWQQGNISCHTAGSAYGRTDHSAMITLKKRVSVSELDRKIFIPKNQP